MKPYDTIPDFYFNRTIVVEIGRDEAHNLRYSACSKGPIPHKKDIYNGGQGGI